MTIVPSMLTVKYNAHGMDSSTVRGIFVATPQPFIACEGGRFGDAGKLDSKFTFHEVLVQSKGIARSLSQSGGERDRCGLGPLPLLMGEGEEYRITRRALPTPGALHCFLPAAVAEVALGGFDARAELALDNRFSCSSSGSARSLPPDRQDMPHPAP